MNGIFDTYARLLLNLECQTYDVSGKRGAPKNEITESNA